MSDKLDLKTPDMVNLNIERIAALFPHCVVETQGFSADTETQDLASLQKKIDFDLLRQELSADIVEGPKERYRLEWPGKREAIVTANMPTTNTLRPVREDSVNFDTTENLYIEGDNLEVLKLLQESYLGKVKMIYIDPPYNTGNDFVYRDNFAQSTEEFKADSGMTDELGNRLVANPETAGRYHSDWLTMMYPRLKLARNLLTDDGVIFISIDDNEVHNLRKMCDEVFGEVNFVAEFPRITKKAGKTTDTIAKNNDYIICFGKSDKCNFNTYNHTDEGYKFEDEFLEERGKYKLSQTLDYGSIQYSPSLDYEIHLEGKILRPGNVSKAEMEERKIRNPKSDFCWRWSKDLYDFGLKNGFIVLKETKDSIRIYTKTYENAIITKGYNGYVVEQTARTKSATSLDFIENEFSNDNSRKDLGKIFDGKIFDYSKPISLIKSLSYLTTSNESIILDFFSGSATTAHAVMQLNAEDGGNRKFIMVQLPEKTDEKSEAFKAGYQNICEIGKERIRRAGAKIVEMSRAASQKAQEKGASLFDGEETRHATSLPDIGFRVYRLDTSNMQDVYYRPQDYKQQTVMNFANHIKPDRKADDLVAQVMLDWGLPLSLPIERATIAGKTVYKVAGNALYCCFDEGIDEEFVRAMCTSSLRETMCTSSLQQQPLRIVFHDYAFAHDTAKENVRQLLKQLSAETEMRVV